MHCEDQQKYIDFTQQIVFLLRLSSRVLPKHCDNSGFLSIQPRTWASSEHKGGPEWSHTFPVAMQRTKPPTRSSEHRSSGTNKAFCLLCRGAVGCAVLGLISYLMQWSWGEKIHQGDDTILDLKDERSSEVIGGCIFQCR